MRWHLPGQGATFAAVPLSADNTSNEEAGAGDRAGGGPSRWQLGADAGVAGLLWLALGWTMWHLGGFRPETMVVTVTLLAGAGAIEMIRRALEPAPPRWAAATWVGLPFLLYAGWNVLTVTPVRWAGGLDWGTWALMALVFGLAVNGVRLAVTRRWLARGVVGWALLGVGAQFYQRLVDPSWLPMGRTQADQFLERSSGTFGVPNSQAAFLLLILPAVVVTAWDARRSRTLRGAAAGAALALVAGLGLTVSRGAWLATMAVAVGWPLLAGRRPWRQRFAIAGGVAAVLVVLGGAVYTGSTTVRERFAALVTDAGERTRPIMWRGAVELFKDAPVTGTGAGSYNVLFERHRPAGFRDEPQWAHNDYLNTLSDYGAAGFLLSFGWVALVMMRAWWRGRARSPLAAEAGWFAVAVFGVTLLIDFHLKIPALGMMAALVVAGLWWESARGETSAAASSNADRRSGAGRRWFAVLGLGGVVAALVLVARPFYAAEGSRYAARRDLDGLAGEENPAREAAVAAKSKAALQSVVATYPGHAQAWADLAYADVLSVRHVPDAWHEAGRRAEEAARRALAGSADVPEYWLRLGVALDMQGRWGEAGPCFAEAVKLAPNNAIVWFHQAYHFSLKRGTLKLAATALATCLRLDPGMGAAEALRAQLDGLVGPAPSKP